VYLLGSGEDVFQSPGLVFKRSLDKFSNEQKYTSIDLLIDIINVGTGPSQLQKEFIGKIKLVMYPDSNKNEW
jgi:hypothetical protein